MDEKKEEISRETTNTPNLTLSPIVELDESDIIGNMLSGRYEEKTESLPAHEAPADMNTVQSVIEISQTNKEVPNSRSCGAGFPVTPPELLRKRLNNLQNQYEYLSTEHEELVEFTKLEKQITHVGCIPKEKVRSLEDDLTSLHGKVQHLMYENSDLKQEINQKDEVIKELERNIATNFDKKENSQQTFLHIGRGIRRYLEDDIEMINKINSVLQRTSNLKMREINLLPEDCDFSLQNGLEYLKNLLEVFETNKSQLKLNIEELYFNDIQQCHVNKELNNKLTELENTLIIHEKEKVQFHELLQVTDMSVNKLSEEVAILQNKLKDAECLKESIYLEKINLQNEIEHLTNIITVNDIQQELTYVVDEFECFIDSWSKSFKFKDVLVSFDDNKTLLHLLDILINPMARNKFIQVLEKLKNKLVFYDEENEQLHSSFEKLKYRIENYESETKELKLDLRKLNYQYKEELVNKMNQLETIFKVFSEGNKCVVENYVGSKSEIIPEAIHTCVYKLIEAEHLVDVTDCEKSKLQTGNQSRGRFIKLDTVQEEIQFILKEFEKMVDAWDGTCSLEEGLAQLKQDNKISCINVLYGVNIQNILFKVLHKLRCKVNLCEQSKAELCKNIEELSAYVQQLESENYALNNITSNSEYHINGKACIVKPTQENNTIDSAEELQILKELMVLELTSLDCGENEELLMHSSSAEIFSKLMQNIIRKEGEVSLDLEKQFKCELENSQERLEKICNKLKSQESWLTTLENENDKMSKELTTIKKEKADCDIKLKYALNESKYSLAEISVLKSKVLEITTENDMLRADIDSFKDLTKSTTDSVKIFQNKVSKLTEELEISKNVISELKSKISTLDYCNNKKDMPLEEKNIKEPFCLCHQNHSNLNINTYSYTGCLNVNSIGYNKIEDINCEKTQLLCGIEKEKALLKDLLKYNVNDTTLSEQLFTFSNSIFIQKEVINLIANKVMELETSNTATIQDFQNIINSISKDLNELKLNIIELFNELKIDTSSILTSGNVEVISLKRELEFVKGTCKEICDQSREFENSAKIGQSLTKKFRDLLKTIQNEANSRTLIAELKKTIEFKEQTIIEQEVKLEAMSNKINVLTVNNQNLDVLVKDLQSQLSGLKFILPKLEIGFPLELDNIDATITHFNEKSKKLEENKLNVIKAEEEVRFFSIQCYLMISHIMNIEHDLAVVQNQQETLAKECIVLKDQAICTNTHLAEANVFASKVISKLPFKVSSINEAMEIMCNIFSEYTSLKEAQVKLLQEIKLLEEKICLHCEEMQSQKKINANLKLELSAYEESIRNLRSELRNLRLHSHRRKENECVKNNILVKKEKISRETQTSDCCFNELELQILKYKEALEDRGSQITSLQIQIQKENYPYKSKVCELEQALAQAKGIIRTLKLETIMQKNNDYSKDLNDLHGKCQEKLNSL